MAELKYLFFLGCAIPYRLPSYEISSRKVLRELSVKLVEMPEYNCCGFPLDPVNHDIMLALATRNLCLAEQQSLPIMTLCNGCFGILNHVNKELKKDKKIKEKVNEYLKEIGMEFKGTATVKHLIHVLAGDVGIEKIKVAIKNPLDQLRVVQHSGCHVNRPKEYIGLEDPENPTILKKLIEATGAECLSYLDEPECCGAPIVGVNEKIPLQLTREKLHHVKAVGAQAMITVCPYCHIMYDLNQPRIERTFGEKFGIPVLHYPQLLGLSMGIAPEELALKDLRVNASEIVNICSQ